MAAKVEENHLEHTVVVGILDQRGIAHGTIPGLPHWIVSSLRWVVVAVVDPANIHNLVPPAVSLHIKDAQIELEWWEQHTIRHTLPTPATVGTFLEHLGDIGARRSHGSMNLRSHCRGTTLDPALMDVIPAFRVA